MTKQERRIKALMRSIGNGSNSPWNPRGKARHMKKFGVSSSTSNRDFDTALDRIWAKRRTA